MFRKITWITIALFFIAMIFIVCYCFTQNGVFLSLAISFGVTFYHFAIRLIIGLLFQKLMKNKANPNRKWYQEHKWEEKLYQILHIKRWKNHLPTARKQDFDPRYHSYEEIVMAMCQSEISHELCMVVSFFPLFLIIPFGTWPVFVITSVLSALFDSLFVMIQRYNRPRVRHLIELRLQRENIQSFKH